MCIRDRPLTDDIASVAFWYQTEPHAAFPSLPARDALRQPLTAPYDEVRGAYLGAASRAIQAAAIPEVYRLAAIGELFYAGRFEDTLRRLREG